MTTLELLPIHAFIDDRHLVERGLSNYWGYNTLSLLRARAALRPGGCARRLSLDGRAPARCRHRDHARRRLQPHRGRQSPRPDAELSRHRQHVVLLAHCRINRATMTNFTGCGNALNLTHPRVLQMVMDSLRYWVEVGHVDGFRFDLATTLGRGPNGFDRGAAFFAAIAAGSGARRRQADRRALGHRAGRLPGRQLPARMVGMERCVSPHAAPLLDRRRET